MGVKGRSWTREGASLGSPVEADDGQKFDAGDELVVASETGVVTTLVVDHAGVEIGQSCERNGSALHVLKDRLELALVAGLDDALAVNPEAGVLP